MLRIHLGDEDVHVVHHPPGHADSDSIVHFERSGLLYLGNILATDGYPQILVDRRGSVAGLIQSSEIFLKRFGRSPKKISPIVPGRGPLATMTELRAYRDMLADVRERVRQFIERTIAANIAYGRPGASIEEIETAGRAALCDEFVSQMKDGYGTLIGERGVRLSGGQRQRIAIARALLAQPPVLVLDEATANLDGDNERKVQLAIANARRGRTTLIISHRPSNLAYCDQTLVLMPGRVGAASACVVHRNKECRS